MADIVVTNTALTQVYLVPTTTDLSTVAKIETAITTAKKMDMLQNLGDILMTRSEKEYKFIDTNEVAVSTGGITLSSLDVDFLFDSQNATGQSELRSMFLANTRKRMIVQLTDEPTSGASPHPTYIDFEVAVTKSGVSIPIDDAVMFKTTIKVCSIPVFNMAAETTV